MAFHGAFTDMLIFFKSLSLVCVCIQNQQQIAHLQTIPEKQRLVPDGSGACLILSIFFKISFLPLLFHLLLEMNEINWRGRSSICGGAIDLDGARARGL